MRLRAHTLLLVVTLGLAGWLSAPASATEPRFETGEEIIELDSASVRFQVRLFGLARVVGQFERLVGRLVHDNDPESGEVHMQIEVSSVNTEDAWRDDYLRGPTFFDAERFPEISFSGTCVNTGIDGRRRIVGELSLRGMTRPVAFDIEPEGAVDEYGGQHYQAKTVIRRSEFGLNSLRHIVSDEVEITVAMHLGVTADL